MYIQYLICPLKGPIKQLLNIHNVDSWYLLLNTNVYYVSIKPSACDKATMFILHGFENKEYEKLIYFQLTVRAKRS